MGVDVEVGQVGGGATEQVEVPEDAGGPPHVLVLDVGGVRELQHLDREEVVALVHVGRHIELGGEAGPLGHAHVGAVDVDLGVALDAVHLEDDPLPLGGGIEANDALVGAGRVLRRDEWRVDRERVTLIGVLEEPVAVDLPHVRDVDGVPAVLRLRRERRRHAGGVVEEPERPVAAQVDEADGFRPVAGGGEFRGGVAEEVGAGSQAVAPGERRILPVETLRH